ncbi:hypothetical protein B7486_52750 [cyanobacterium TDX16]|nr:hypothetical protein B7486_52750 [cyanobacterium TDX16]
MRAPTGSVRRELPVARHGRRRHARSMGSQAEDWDAAVARAKQSNGGWSAPRSAIGRPVLPALGVGVVVLVLVLGLMLALGANVTAAAQTAVLPALAVGGVTYQVIVRGRTSRWLATGDPDGDATR